MESLSVLTASAAKRIYLAMKYCVVETSRGFIAILEKDGRLVRSTLPKPTREEAVAAGVTGTNVEDESAFGILPEKLRAYFEGKYADFSDVLLNLDGQSPFGSVVLLTAQRIPYGKVITYGELARLAGSPGAARAVGNIMARNMTPIIVPCHRVIAAGGKIGGFSSGLEWKRELLRLEGINL